MRSREIPLFPKVFPMNPDRRLPLQEFYRIGNAVLLRNAQAHMHVIRQGMAFDQFDAILATQISENLSDVFPKSAKNGLPSVLWDEYQMVLAIPSHMGLALPFSHLGLLSIERDGSLKGDLDQIARRNGRAFSSLSAGGGGLPI